MARWGYTFSDWRIGETEGQRD